MKIVFFSDTHLNKEDESKTKVVATFIREVCRDADVVFLLGDIFEFYHGYAGIYPWYLPVADSLKEIRDEGRTVYFIEGNHEYDVGSYFESYTGVVCAESVSMEVDGKRLFVGHGDQFVGGALRVVLKSRLTAKVMDFLGPRVTWALAMVARIFLSQTEKEYNSRAVRAFRGYASSHYPFLSDPGRHHQRFRLAG